jgi:ribosomal protein S18 acetylase RimI-like enzyme
MLEIVECRHLTPKNIISLGDFFESLNKTGDAKYFHPHPLTQQEASTRIAYQGRDLYYVIRDEPRILAYGMLRGWDEGYETPTIGIATHPDFRHIGIARALMIFLHTSARHRGAKQIMLKTHPANTPAIRLYESLGYVPHTANEKQLVFHKSLE